jgi:hypothetical protein
LNDSFDRVGDGEPVASRPHDVIGQVDPRAQFWRDAFESLIQTLVGEYGTFHVATLITTTERRARSGFPLPTDVVTGFGLTFARGMTSELAEIEHLRRVGQRPGAPDHRSICRHCLSLSTDAPRSKYCESPRAPQMPDGKNSHAWALCDSEDGLVAMAERKVKGA